MSGWHMIAKDQYHCYSSLINVFCRYDTNPFSYQFLAANGMVHVAAGMKNCHWKSALVFDMSLVLGCEMRWHAAVKTWRYLSDLYKDVYVGSFRDWCSQFCQTWMIIPEVTDFSIRRLLLLLLLLLYMSTLLVICTRQCLLSIATLVINMQRMRVSQCSVCCSFNHCWSKVTTGVPSCF